MTLVDERRSTRIYLVLLSSCMLSLFIYYSLTQYSVILIQLNPTEDLYKTLSQSPLLSSLQCPCTHLTIPYRTFVQANTSIHPVCSSPFIESSWIESIYGNGDWYNSNQTDFHSRSALYFSGLRAFCQVFQENTSHFISDFLSSTLINSQVISEMDLDEQINDVIERNQAANRQDASGMYIFGDELGSTNQMLTVYSSNWVISQIPDDVNVIGLPLAIEPMMYGNCSCATSSKCSQSMILSGEIVPGFVVACSPLQTIFQSSLVCLYNDTCLNRINERNLLISPLVSPSNLRKYPINRTIEELMEKAFDQEWSVQRNYSQYFEECRPISCSYSINRQKSLVQTLSMLLGFYGGFNVALRFFSPYFSRFIGKYCRVFARNQSE